MSSSLVRRTVLIVSTAVAAVLGAVACGTPTKSDRQMDLVIDLLGDTVGDNRFRNVGDTVRIKLIGRSGGSQSGIESLTLVASNLINQIDSVRLSPPKATDSLEVTYVLPDLASGATLDTLDILGIVKGGLGELDGVIRIRVRRP